MAGFLMAFEQGSGHGRLLRVQWRGRVPSKRVCRRLEGSTGLEQQEGGRHPVLANWGQHSAFHRHLVLDAGWSLPLASSLCLNPSVSGQGPSEK